MMHREDALAALLPVFFVLLLLGSSAWIKSLVGTPVGEDLPGFSREPESILEQAHIQIIGKVSGVNQSLIATRVFDFPDEESQKLEQPVFVRTEAGNRASRTEIRADRGLVTERGENVYFLGAVRMNRIRPGDDAPLRLETEYLRVMPSTDRMRTEKQVVLHQGKQVLTAAHGMEADGKQRTVVFNGPVRSVYEHR